MNQSSISENYFVVTSWTVKSLMCLKQAQVKWEFSYTLTACFCKERIPRETMLKFNNFLLREIHNQNLRRSSCNETSQIIITLVL